MIVYSPEEKNVKENVREWVQLIAAKSPGARIVLVSTHSKSVKLEGSSVEKLAKEVEQEVQAEIKVVNTGTKEEASRLEKKIEAFKERERAATDDNERQQLLKELEAEKERLRSLTESEDGKKTMKEVSLLSGQVWCVDSVEGDGVVELREVLKKEIGELPFVGELVPAQWVRVKKTVEDKYREIAGKQLVSKQELISCLDLEREEWKGMDEKGAWEAVEFYELLGDWKVFGDNVLLDLRLLMELNKALAFHCPTKALERMDCSKEEECDKMFVPGFKEMSDEEKQQVREAAKVLEEKAEVCESLLAKLYKWNEMSREDRKGLMKMMEEMNFVSSIGSNGGEERWVALLRLVWTFGGAGEKQAVQGAYSTFASDEEKALPAAVYKLRYVPPGFYSQIAGCVLRLRDECYEWRDEREVNALRVHFKTKGGKEHSLVVLKTEKGLELRSSSMAMIVRVCEPAEKFLGTQFPGIIFTVEVRNMSQEHDPDWEDVDGMKNGTDDEIADHILSKTKDSLPRKRYFFDAAGLRAALAKVLTEDDGRVGGEIPFPGRVLKGRRWLIASFPGIHSYVWKKVTKNDRHSSNCVFFPGKDKLNGTHCVLDKEKLRGLLELLYCVDLLLGLAKARETANQAAKEEIERLRAKINDKVQKAKENIERLQAEMKKAKDKKVCYCMTLYPDHLRKHKAKPEWGCGWYQPWVDGLIEGLDDGQQPIVVYQDEFDPRSTYDLLGGSQRGEVRYAEAQAKLRGMKLKYVSVKELRPLL